MNTETFLFVLILFKVIETTNITLISLTFLEDDNSAGFLQTNPIYDILMRRIREQDLTIFENLTHIALKCAGMPFSTTEKGSSESEIDPDTGLPLPSDDTVASCFFSFYYRNENLFLNDLSKQFTIITTPSLDGGSEEMARFSQQINTLVAVSVPENTLSDIRTYPTTLNMFGMPEKYFAYCLAIMTQNFAWAGINFVCGAPSDSSTPMFFCNTFDEGWRESVSRNLPYTRYDLDPETVASGNNSSLADYVDILSKISDRRTVLLFLSPLLLRNFMMAACQQNMTNGDFVFVTFSPQGIPSKDDFYWKANDENDDLALAGFRALLVIPDGANGWNGSEDFRNELNEEYARRYNWSISPQDQSLADPIRMLELMLIFADNFKRSLSRLGHITMKEFVEGFTNHTYQLPTRTIFVNETGAMIVPVKVTRVDENGVFRTFMICDLVASEIYFEGVPDWFGHDSLPTEIPECGLHREKCPLPYLEIIEVAFSLIGACIFISLLRQFIRGKILKSRLNHLLIDSKEITAPPQPNRPKVQKTSQGRPERCTTESPNLSKATIFHPKNRDTNNLSLLSNHESKPELLPQKILRGNNQVYVKIMATQQSVKTLTVDTEFSSTVVQLSRLQNQYLAEFYGICLDRGDLSVVFECPTKGPLMTVLEHSAVFHDTELRLTLMANIIEGLHFIHTSDLKYHGALCSQVCLLNDRYTVRIALAGFDYLATKLLTNKNGKNVWTKLWRLWKGQKQLTILDYQRQDIRNLGLIVAEMLEIDMTSKTTHMTPGDGLQAVIKTVSSCLNPDAVKRPTIVDLIRWIKAEGFAKQSMVELLMHRLQNHANALEHEVELRSADLMVEMQNVDDLLNEMLPRTVISKLRNQETITAELYESATILFSDIPVFARLVAECTPMEVVTFLSQIHSDFDRVLSPFDAYKVETINDSYMVVSGIPLRNGNRHAVEICQLALALRVAGSSILVPSWGDIGICPRFGINSGLAAAGVVGTRMPRYCLFGDTVNTASRMESHGAANRIHVSASTRILALTNTDTSNFRFVSRGLLKIKGKGMLETYWLQDCEKHKPDN